MTLLFEIEGLGVVRSSNEVSVIRCPSSDPLPDLSGIQIAGYPDEQVWYDTIPVEVEKVEILFI